MPKRRWIAFVAESAAIGDATIFGPWHSEERAEAVLRPFLAKRPYLSGIVMELLEPREARAELPTGDQP